MAIPDDEPKPTPRATVGEDITRLSVHELEARIAALEGEIVRSRAALASRRATSAAANALFRPAGDE